MNKTREFHPVANIFPTMNPDEFNDLVSDIEKNGLLESIWLDKDGVIIDGRNRYSACLKAGIEPTFRTWEGQGSLIEFVVSLNLKRRHLTASQKACVAVEVEEHLAIEAKERQKEAGKLYGENHPKEELVAKLPQPLGRSRDTAAKMVGVSGRYVSDVKRIKRQSAEIFDSVASGEITIQKANQILLKQDDPTVSNSKFNESNENIDWAKWSWNPVTGCRNGCLYCYGRSIATHYPDTFPKGFDYDVHRDRFNAPRNTKIPEAKIKEEGIRNVFVCSMADLFGDWVEIEVIREILDICSNTPQWNYIFLTKNPTRLLEFEFPANSAVGTTVDVKSRVATAVEIMPQVKAPIKFISCEPLLEDLELDDLSWIDWIIIGSQTDGARIAVHPEWAWIKRLQELADSQNIPTYWKPNLYRKFKNYPKFPAA